MSYLNFMRYWIQRRVKDIDFARSEIRNNCLYGYDSKDAPIFVVEKAYDTPMDSIMVPVPGTYAEYAGAGPISPIGRMPVYISMLRTRLCWARQRHILWCVDIFARSDLIQSFDEARKRSARYAKRRD